MMKGFKLFLLLVSLVSFGFQCGKEKLPVAKGEAAILYYFPQCSSIKGYIRLEEGGKIYVFQHPVSPDFTKNGASGTPVYITYRIEGPKILTAECTQADVITIDHIQLR